MSIKSYTQIFMTWYLFLKFSSNKWEQKHRALGTYINNGYANVIKSDIEFNTKQTENTKSTERLKASFPKESVKNADFNNQVLNKIMATHE